jgi:hypothetical protein
MPSADSNLTGAAEIANKLGGAARHASAIRIVPLLQNIAVGTVFPALPGH